ncbi:MAG: hypothetical protein HKN13_11000 [Rhodothermales bacterium]|nr:hypothetical protein [Rhodothermales bacterium]
MNAKRFFSSTALLLIPVAFFALLEGGLRLAGVGADNQNLFQEIPGKEEYLAMSPGYVGRYFTGFRPSIAFNPFEKIKGPETFRIVVLGGSSTAGFPYQFNYGFPARLNNMLQAATPGQRIEVVNLGMTAVNSYTLWDIRNAVLEQRPDAIIIYAGHNEYYGAFGAGSSINRLGNSIFLKRLVLRLKHLALYRWLEDTITSKPVATDAGEGRTMMAQVVRDSEIDRDGRVFAQGIEQFESNLSRVLDTFAGEAIPVYIGTLVSNLRDQRPLGVSEPAKAAFESGTRLLRADSVAASRQAYLQAKDYDNIRFRAPELINDAIRRLSEGSDITLVDIQSAFVDRSARNIEGADLFTDHLHPNGVGYDLMARAFLESLRSHPKLRFVDSTRAAAVDIDAVGRAHAEIQIGRLLAGYPFNKEASAEEQVAALERTFRLREQSGYADSLAVATLKRNATMSQALLIAARLARQQRDTTNALLFYRAVQDWQPFNETIGSEALSFAINNSRHDRLVGDIAQFAVSRTGRLNQINALAAIRIRQHRLAAAEVLLDRSESIDPENKTMAYNKARLLILTGDTLAAARYFQLYQK